MRSSMKVFGVLVLSFIVGWLLGDLAIAQVTGTAQVAVEPTLSIDKQIERYTQIIVATLTALGIAFATIIQAYLMLRAKTKALIATVKGTEEALDMVRVTSPKLYRESKDILKARTQEFSAVKEIVQEIHEAEKKAHTQTEIRVPPSE